jgi:hypothetical protein
MFRAMRAPLALSLAALAACTQNSTPPGDEQLGSFSFHAEPPGSGNQATCVLTDIPDGGFDFTATFSHFRDGGTAFVSIGGVSHAGTFDGTTITATYSAPRSFANCSACGTTVSEVMTVLLLSESQDQALGSMCPGAGMSPPIDLDAGITPPMSAGSGFDATRGCGTLVDSVASDPLPDPGTNFTDAGCWSACNDCLLHYVIVGERQ